MWNLFRYISGGPTFLTAPAASCKLHTRAFANMSCKDLHVLVVGAGFAGLTASIECRLRGMKVTLLESYPTSRNYGDILDFAPNGGLHMERWDNGNVVKRLMQVCMNDTDQFEYFKYDGTKIFEEPFLLKKEHYFRMLAGHRGEMHEIVCGYATQVGVDVRFGEKVAQYIDTVDERGVLTTTGKKYTCDVLVAADGPKSLGRTQILGLPETKVNSGYAIYRAYFNLNDEHRSNPLLAPLCLPSPNFAGLWVGDDLHMIVYTWKAGKDLGWVFTHKVWLKPPATEAQLTAEHRMTKISGSHGRFLGRSKMRSNILMRPILAKHARRSFAKLHLTSSWTISLYGENQFERGWETSSGQ